MHTLSTRATNIPAPLPDDPTKTTMKKAYYLACGFCRWTSRDVGMADKSVGESWHFPDVDICASVCIGSSVNSYDFNLSCLIKDGYFGLIWMV